MKRKLVAPSNQSPIKKDVQFVRSFEHVDGNWPSHVYLDGNITFQAVEQTCKLAFTLVANALLE